MIENKIMDAVERVLDSRKFALVRAMLAGWAVALCGVVWPVSEIADAGFPHVALAAASICIMIGCAVSAFLSSAFLRGEE